MSEFKSISQTNTLLKITPFSVAHLTRFIIIGSDWDAFVAGMFSVLKTLRLKFTLSKLLKLLHKII